MPLNVPAIRISYVERKHALRLYTWSSPLDDLGTNDLISGFRVS
jgi:hypothetical protein